jgi:branched-chain amino acid transport system substrate-binding protein
MVEDGGATPNSATTALDGFSGANVAGLDIELVGIGCGDDTPDRIIQEVRTLVEQDGAEVVIGPLSGDESIAVANYAKDHPEVTFIDGIAGAQDTTLKVQAPNYFRFHGDGAQWNAGLGERVHTEAGWDTVAVIADDYSFGWTSAAGFIADFCAVGGDVVARVFPPLGTTDYSSFVQQLPDPDEVDGYFWVVGGTGTNAALEAFVNAKGDLDGAQHAGNLFFSPALASALGPNIAGAYVGGFASLPGDVKTPEIDAYLASADATWESLAAGAAGGEVGPPSVAMGFGFAYGYYVAGKALNQALEAVGGDDDLGRAVRLGEARREPSRDHHHLRPAARTRRERRGRQQDGSPHPRRRPELRRDVHTRDAVARPREPAVRGARPAVDRQRNPRRRRGAAGMTAN